MDEAPAPGPLPPGLRWLQGLVIVLTLTMIVAVITIVGVLVTRAPQVFSAGAMPKMPAELTLPAGAKALAVTQGQGWIAVVTSDDRILIFDRKGALRQEVALVEGLAD
jgi:streptomycin 6-kinase